MRYYGCEDSIKVKNMTNVDFTKLEKIFIKTSPIPIDTSILYNK